MKNTLYNDENIAKYFAGELDEKKLEMMEKDILHNNDKEQEIRDFSRLWEKSAELAAYDKIDADADWQMVRGKMGFTKSSKTIQFSKYIVRIAAVLVIAAGLAFLYNIILKQDRVSNDYLQFSAINATQEFVLPDNSKVTLNRNATLFYSNNYGKNNRDVILKGEGFFQVTKNKELPFKVFVNNSTIEVLGTSFNIKPEDNDVVVSVVTGHVAFYETTRKENRVDLVKDEQSEFDTKDKVFTEKSKIDENNLAWRTHRLFFKRENVKDVFETIAEYYGKELEIKKNVNLIDYPFSGEYSDVSIDTVIKEINSLYSEKFDINVTDSKLIIDSKRKK
jgi:transmembrane sensor